jgi:hypothetical protein
MKQPTIRRGQKQLLINKWNGVARQSTEQHNPAIAFPQQTWYNQYLIEKGD